MSPCSFKRKRPSHLFKFLLDREYSAMFEKERMFLLFQRFQNFRSAVFSFFVTNFHLFFPNQAFRNAHFSRVPAFQQGKPPLYIVACYYAQYRMRSATSSSCYFCYYYFLLFFVLFFFIFSLCFVLFFCLFVCLFVFWGGACDWIVSFSFSFSIFPGFLRCNTEVALRLLQGMHILNIIETPAYIENMYGITRNNLESTEQGLQRICG